MEPNKLKSVCTAKKTINKMKRQHMGWERIFAKEENKGTIFKIYKQFIQLNIYIYIYKPNQKMGRGSK